MGLLDPYLPYLYTAGRGMRPDPIISDLGHWLSCQCYIDMGRSAYRAPIVIYAPISPIGGMDVVLDP